VAEKVPGRGQQIGQKAEFSLLEAINTLMLIKLSF
jgi:hypothetical protein